MSKTAPWIKFFAADFLNGIVDLDADEIGAYTIVLALIWDRGTPIADDAAWLARRAGTSTRRFNQIRAKLISLGKLEARNGLLGNRRAIEEVQARDKKSDQARTAALARWYGHGEPELPLGDNGELNADVLEKKPRKNAKKAQEQIDLNSRKSGHKPQNSADPDDADAYSPSRAPAFQSPETRVIHTINQEIHVEADAEPEAPEEPAAPAAINPLNHRDLVDLMHSCTDAAGFRPSSPGVVARELDIVKGWREQGIDFELIVIPTIQHMISKTSDPTSSLKRFDKSVRLEFAKAGAKPKEGSAAYRAPESPILEVEGEPEIMRAVRADLLKAIGPHAYCMFFNPVRLEQVEEAGGGRNPLRIVDNRPSSLQVMNSPHQTTVRNIAQKHGFSAVW